jgi:hypothetical protein
MGASPRSGGHPTVHGVVFEIFCVGPAAHAEAALHKAGLFADDGDQIGCNRHHRRSAIGKGPYPRHVAIVAAGQRRAGQNENQGNDVAEGSHRLSPFTIWR